MRVVLGEDKLFVLGNSGEVVIKDQLILVFARNFYAVRGPLEKKEKTN